MLHCTVWIGTSTNDPALGIYILNLDLDAGNPVVRNTEPAPNPSYLLASEDGTILYAALEVSDWEGTGGGAVAAYRKHGDRLCLLNTRPTMSPGPCHLSLQNHVLYCAGFGLGAVSAFPLGEDGSLLPCQTVYYRDVPCAPQKAAHTHQTVPAPSGRLLCAVDLGLDSVFLHPIDSPTDLKAVRCVPVPQGCGPRNMVFSAHGTRAYLCGELDNHVIVFGFDGQNLIPLQRIPALPADYASLSYCGAICLSEDGRFLLVSNRGQNCIAVFHVDGDGLLEPPNWQDCGGNFPRDMAFSPDGRYLLCANQRGDTVSVLRWQKESGHLAFVSSVAVPRPTCVSF